MIEKESAGKGQITNKKIPDGSKMGIYDKRSLSDLPSFIWYTIVSESIPISMR